MKNKVTEFFSNLFSENFGKLYMKAVENLGGEECYLDRSNIFKEMDNIKKRRKKKIIKNFIIVTTLLLSILSILLTLL